MNNEKLYQIISDFEEMSTIYRKTRNIFEHIDEKIFKDDQQLKEMSTISNHFLEMKHGKIRIFLH
ncbi:hypothetical protein KHA80_03155 [Anaerobacillus sp. HL2]|nr:hypothetical protein KHA80_03155 [Anaerobacillus sp. HL2]